jgi:hypothetical protein
VMTATTGVGAVIPPSSGGKKSLYIVKSLLYGLHSQGI